VTPPDVMADIRALVGDDLLDRPRHGRIRCAAAGCTFR
jgi:hypothetical protein